MVVTGSLGILSFFTPYECSRDKIHSSTEEIRLQVFQRR